MVSVKNPIERPLLAAKFDDPDQISEALALLSYPLFGSPKYDGIRCLCHPTLGPVSRSFKSIPNHYVREKLSKEVSRYMDGELIVGAPETANVFNVTTSAIMSHDGTPQFTYLVFDMFDQPSASFAMRQEFLKDSTRNLTVDKTPGFKIEVVPQVMLATPAKVIEYEQACLEAGYEGICLRSPQGPYKSGRSTLKEQILIKLKRVEDAEATIIGFEALTRNQNVQTKDAFGLAKRSSQGAGKTPDNLLGKLRVQNDTFGDFSVGSGFDVDTRAEIWANQSKYLGKAISFKYQKVGIVDKPRFPIFKAFRED